MQDHKTFSLEKYALNNINYLENMVDENNQPYFNIFWTDPVSAVHDWPDFCDVAVRQLQAAIMIRCMTGKKINNEDYYRKNFFSCFKHNDGLIYRPESAYTKHLADIDEQTLALFNLVSLMQDEKSTEVEGLIKQMIDTFRRIGVIKDNCFWFPSNKYYPDGWHDMDIDNPGKSFYMMMVRPLVQYYKLTNYKPAYNLAEQIINGILTKSGFLLKNNTFIGHVHAHLSFLAGTVDFASVREDESLLKKMDEYYKFIRSKSTAFGWIPEETGRKSDCIGCETCAIMDYLHLAILLAKNGYEEYWDDIERITRNHLIESQFSDMEWMKTDNDLPDTDEITYRNIYKRMRGGFAGWSSPNHYLAYLEYLPDGWLQNKSNVVLNKYRITQNCCGGSGVRSLYHVWKNIAEIKNNTLIVNLHIDKKLKDAEIRCLKPYHGITEITPVKNLKVKIRIPDFTDKEDISVIVNNEIKSFYVEGKYMFLGEISGGSKIEVEYPLPQKNETISIGNEGYQQYRYDISWLGDTVKSIKSHEDNPIRGYSHINKTKVKVFGREEGPGNLYRREYLDDEKIVPVREEINTDNSSVEF
jgi:hypothetical protein